MYKILVICLFWLGLSAGAPPKSQLLCLKKCHEAYCSRAQKAFWESERLVFKDFTQSRYQYQQGLLYLQRARCVLLRMEQLKAPGPYCD